MSESRDDPMPRTLTEDDVRRLDPARVIAAIEAAFRDRYPTTIIPARTHIPTADGVALIMPCYDGVTGALGMKLVTVLNHPPEPGARIQATYLLLDPATARPRLLIPANYLTDLRTAATSAVATKHLAREDAKTLGIFGIGRQARAHLKVLRCVRNFNRILVCGTDTARTRLFAQEMTDEIHAPVEPAEAQTLARESDVLCTCTTSNTNTPLFDGAVLRPGTHLNVIGAFQPHTREVDDVAVQRSRVVVETYDAVLAEAGDLLIPMSKGLITRDHICADLHELVSGKKTVRTTTDDITLFKSVGCALEDLVTAELIEKTLFQ
jgi:ornithine cyclodeaminase/alanine dehydrogenase-like protein (mu-crystallin family)